MGNPDSRIGRVHRLTAGTGGAKSIDSQVFLINLNFDIVCFRQHGHSHSRSMNSATSFRSWHALNSMNAALVLEFAVSAFALNNGDHFLQATNAGDAGR